MSKYIYTMIAKWREEWPAFFARSETGRLTGGAIAPGTCANRDSAGTGPPGRFMVGKKVCYERDQFLDWLAAQLREPPDTPCCERSCKEGRPGSRLAGGPLGGGSTMRGAAMQVGG